MDGFLGADYRQIYIWEQRTLPELSDTWRAKRTVELKVVSADVLSEISAENIDAAEAAGESLFAIPALRNQ